MTVLDSNNGLISGQGTRPIVFAHGYGCDQVMWRLVAPAFERDYKVVLVDNGTQGHTVGSCCNPERGLWRGA